MRKRMHLKMDTAMAEEGEGRIMVHGAKSKETEQFLVTTLSCIFVSQSQ
jgi:hypothetical protein